MTVVLVFQWRQGLDLVFFTNSLTCLLYRCDATYDCDDLTDEKDCETISYYDDNDASYSNEHPPKNADGSKLQGITNLLLSLF